MKWKDELRSTRIRADSFAFSANKHIKIVARWIVSFISFKKFY